MKIQVALVAAVAATALAGSAMAAASLNDVVQKGTAAQKVMEKNQINFATAKALGFDIDYRRLLGVFRKRDASDMVTLGALVALGITALLVIFAPDHQALAFHGALMVDTFARVMKVLARLKWLRGSWIDITRFNNDRIDERRL